MPLPRGSKGFLKTALVGLKPSGGFVHFYAFADAANPFEETRNLILATAKKNNYSIHFVFEREVRSFSRDTVQIVLDFWAKAN